MRVAAIVILWFLAALVAAPQLLEGAWLPLLGCIAGALAVVGIRAARRRSSVPRR